MAVIWQKKHAGNHYQVRSAGSTRRLYTNGICHTEFNPGKLLTGSIWDLLVLPAFFYPRGEIRRVLMLGVGGGASILQLHHLLAPAYIAGVELDSIHLDIARRFFDIDRIPAHLVQGDAGEWLESYKGEAFDMIIDDLFINDGREPVRAVKADSQWTTKVLRHLRAEGVLVTNFGSDAEFRQSACCSDKEFSRQFRSTFRLSHPQLDNIVGAFLGIRAESADLRKALRTDPLMGPALDAKRLRYRIRNLDNFSRDRPA